MGDAGSYGGGAYESPPSTGLFMQTNFGNASPSVANIDMGGFAIQNLLDPVNPQDAVTKNYVDTIAPPSGANRFLSNLLSPTAINQNLLPNLNTFTLGDLAVANNIWGSLSARDIFISSAGTSFHAQIGNTAPPFVNNDGTGLYVRGGNLNIKTYDRDDGGLSGSLIVSSGDSTVSSGNLTISTGTAPTRGNILFGAEQNHQKNISKEVVWQNGVTGARPGAPVTGLRYFDTTIGKPIWYDGANWVDATGAVV